MFNGIQTYSALFGSVQLNSAQTQSAISHSTTRDPPRLSRGQLSPLDEPIFRNMIWESPFQKGPCNSMEWEQPFQKGPCRPWAPRWGITSIFVCFLSVLGEALRILWPPFGFLWTPSGPTMAPTLDPKVSKILLPRRAAFPS